MSRLTRTWCHKGHGMPCHVHVMAAFFSVLSPCNWLLSAEGKLRYVQTPHLRMSNKISPSFPCSSCRLASFLRLRLRLGAVPCRAVLHRDLVIPLRGRCWRIDPSDRLNLSRAFCGWRCPGRGCSTKFARVTLRTPVICRSTRKASFTG